MAGFFDKNWHHALEHAPLHTRMSMRAGNAMLHGGLKAVKGIDNAVGTAGNALLSPGGAATHALLAPIGGAVNLIKKYPRAGLMAAIAPAAFLTARDKAFDDIRPIMEKDIELGRTPMMEGKTVYANYNKMEKKAALIAKIKTYLTPSVEKHAAFDIQSILSGLAGMQPKLPDVPAGGGGGNGGSGGGSSGVGSSALRGLQLMGMGNRMGDMTQHAAGNGVEQMMKPTAEILGHRISHGLFPIQDRINATDLMAQKGVESFGSSMGNALAGLVTDMASKAYNTVGVLASMPGRHMMINNLMAQDEYIANADPEKLLEAYHTMTKFAPTLSRDVNAVRSFLRLVAAAPDSGLDFTTIAALADAEAKVQKAKVLGAPR